MKVWRMVAEAYSDSAFDGEGAARYTGRWNPRDVRMVYTADSLALATLELVVHLAGARVVYAAIEVELSDDLVTDLSPRQLRRGWEGNETGTQQIGERWTRSAASLALRVPSALVDRRSAEGNVLLNPLHPEIHRIAEVQRFRVVLDERLQ